MNRTSAGQAGKRVMPFLLSLLMLLTACSDGWKTEQANGGEPFTIRIGAWFIDDREYMKQFKTNTEQAYKKLYPQATIQWDITLGDAYFGKLETQLASDSAPDVFFHQHVLSMLEAGYVSDLSGEPWAYRFIPQIQQFLTYKADIETFERYDGKVYSASMGVGIRGYWYNKTLFDRLGLKAPLNSLELLNVCARLKEAGYLPLVAGYKDRWTLDMHFDSLLQSIGYGSDKKFGTSLYEGRKRLDGDEVMSALQFFETIHKKEYINRNALSIDWEQSLQLFASEKAAMIMQGPWLPGSLESEFPPESPPFELGYFPVSDEHGYYDLEFTSDQYVSVNAASRLQKEARALVGVMLSDDVHLPFARSNGLLPAIEGMKPSFGNPVMEEVFAYANRSDSNARWSLFISTESKEIVLEEAENIMTGVPFDGARLTAALYKLEEARADLKPPLE